MRANLLSFAVAAIATGCTEPFAPASQPAVIAESLEVAKSTVRVRLSNVPDDTVVFMVDGVPKRLRAGRLQQLNPNDIESVEVIKASTAAALYGSTTNCPAIIVRTRRP